MHLLQRIYIVLGIVCVLTCLNIYFITQIFIQNSDLQIVNEIDERVSKFLMKLNLKDKLRLTKHFENLKYVLSNNGTYKLINPSAKGLICDAKRDVVHKYILENDGLFQELEKNRAFLDRPLFENKVFEDCALVSNSGDLQGLKNGKFIDLHDMVMRFNYAPTKKYEADVGEKTSIRYLNSQPLRDNINSPLSESLYEASPLVFWDTAEYDTPLTTWRNKTFFKRFFERRVFNASQILHIQDPKSIWSIWDWMESEVKGLKAKTPPSTGFLGFIMALHHCKRIRLFGFIPRIQLTKRCHYFSDRGQKGCLTWHPFSSEKLILLQLNEGSLQETYQHGFITVHGFPAVKC